MAYFQRAAAREGIGVRVTGGTAGRLRLEVPEGPEMRPTQDRVREALFSMLAGRIEGARVLDLFAGTGAFGIEALSRGAAAAVFVESHRACLASIRTNLAHTRLAERSRVAARDVRDFLRDETGLFDLVFADPPYDKGREGAARGRARGSFDAGALFAAVAPRLAPGGMFVYEFFAQNRPAEPAPLRLVREKRYGGTGLWLLEAAG